MTEDERLINESWPLIREVVQAKRPLLERTGLLGFLSRKTVKEQIDFWMMLARLPDLVDADVVRAAREIRG